MGDNEANSVALLFFEKTGYMCRDALPCRDIKEDCCKQNKTPCEWIHLSEKNQYNIFSIFTFNLENICLHNWRGQLGQYLQRPPILCSPSPIYVCYWLIRIRTQLTWEFVQLRVTLKLNREEWANLWQCYKLVRQRIQKKLCKFSDWNEILTELGHKTIYKVEASEISNMLFARCALISRCWSYLATF